MRLSGSTWDRDPGSSRDVRRRYRRRTDSRRAQHSSFISLAVIEVVEGKTDRIDSYVTLESDRLALGELSGPTGFYLDVDLANLDTRLGLSNRHMRNNCLEVEAFRYACFEGTIQEVEGIGGKRLRVWSVGAMEIHGVIRNM